MRPFKIVIALLLTSTVAYSTNYYVSSVSGNDQNSGLSPNQAWGTLEKVSAAVLNPGDSILLKRGETFRGTIIISEPGDSSRPIYIGAYGTGNKPLILGSEPVNGNWTPVSINGITAFKTKFPFRPSFLYVEGNLHQVARHPEGFDAYFLTDWPNIGNGTYSAVRADTLTGVTADLSGAYISLRRNGWLCDTRKIDSLDPADGTVHFSPSLQFSGNMTNSIGFFMSNHLAFLDHPGEFYYDPADSMLYVYPYNGNPPTGVIEASVYGFGVFMDTSVFVPGVEHGLEYLTIKGLKFQNQAIAGIALSDECLHVSILNNEFQNLPFAVTNRAMVEPYWNESPRLFRGMRSHYLTIDNNRVRDAYRSAFNLSLTNNVTITNNILKRIHLIVNAAEWLGQKNYPYGAHASAIEATGWMSTVANNYIDSCGHYGIKMGSDAVVRNNIVKNTCFLYNDCGAIYCAYQSNCVIENNIVENVLNGDNGIPNHGDNGNGIYLDFNSKAQYEHITVKGNTVINAAGGIGTIATHNMVTNQSVPGIQINNNVLYNNRGAAYSRWTSGFPLFPPSQSDPTELSNNVFVGFGRGPLWSWRNNLLNSRDRWSADSNYYINPYSPVISSEVRGNLLNTTTTFYGFPLWQAAGNDPNGKTDFLDRPYPYIIADTLPPGNLIRYPDCNNPQSAAVWSSSPPTGFFGVPYAAVSRVTNANMDSLCLVMVCRNSGGGNSFNFVHSLFDTTGNVSPAPLNSSNQYLISFDLYAPSPRAISFSVIGDGNTLYATNVIPVNSGHVIYQFVFQPDQPVSGAKIRFSIWLRAWENFSFAVDNIHCYPVDATYEDPAEKFPIFVNETGTTKTVSLYHAYLDLDSNAVGSSITIPPFSSRVLFRVDPCDPQPCGIPTNLNAQFITDSSAQLAWDTVAGAVKYELLLSEAGLADWDTIIIPGGDITDTLITGLYSSTEYEWKIKGYCGKACPSESVFSRLSNFTTLCIGTNESTCPYLDPVYTVTRQNDIVYGTALNYRLDSVDLKMDIYTPEDCNTQRPLLVWIHGGGFYEGDKVALAATSTCQAFAERGYVAVSVNYRLGWYGNYFFQANPNAYDLHETVRAQYRAMQDVKGAIRFLKGNADTYGIDTNLVFVGGESAGGFTALHTGYLDKETEKPVSAGQINNVLDRFWIWTLRNAPRPDLGPVEGTLNLNGTSAKVTGVLNFFGAILSTDFIEGPDDPPLFQYHVLNDPVVSCYTAPLFNLIRNLLVGNFPYVHGACAIASQADNVGLMHRTFIRPLSASVPHTMNEFGFIVDHLSLFMDSLICYPSESKKLAFSNHEAQNFSGPKVTLSPNPFSNYTELSFNNPKGDLFRLSIYDLTGNLLRRYESNGEQFIVQRKGLAAGVYIYELVGNGRTRGKLVIVD